MALKPVQNNSHPLSDSEYETINHWVIRDKRNTASETEKQRMDAWLKEDKRRWQDAASLDDLLGSDAFSSALRRYEDEVGLTGFKTTGISSPWYAAIACALVLGLASLLYLSAPTQPQAYQTQAGEVAHQALNDGSVLDISADSHLLVNYNHQERHIDLIKGEAQFNVSKDASSPFVVQPRHASLKALGTVFNVDQRRRITELTVLEGRVEVIPARAADRRLILTAGQSVRIQPQGASAVDQFQPSDYRSWQQGILQAHHMPLQELIDELNRYNQRPIRIAPELRSINITGTFRLNDEPGNLNILSSLYNLSAEDKDNTVILRR